MSAYSLLGPMNDKPYALGERPGGSDIPSIPLLTGRDAWNSISGRCDDRHMDTQLHPEVNHTIAPRPTDSLLDKKAMAEKMARGGGILRVLKQLIPRSPGPLPPGKGINELLAQQRTQIRGRPYKSTPAGTFVHPPSKSLIGKQDLPMLLGLPAIGATGAAGAYGVQRFGDYAGKRRAAAQLTLPTTPVAEPAGTEPAGTESTGGEPPPAAPDALAKAKDFFQAHGTQLGVGAVSGVGLYALYKILQNLTTSKEEKRRKAFEMLPKAAEADPGQFCEEFPKLAGFLCYCHQQDLAEGQIVDGLEKAAADDGLRAELEKLAAGLEGGGLRSGVARQLRGAFRGVKGLKDVGVGGVGTVATGVPWLLSQGYNQTAGRLGAPKIPTQALGEMATDYAAVGRGGLKDIVGANVSAWGGPQDSKYLPQAVNQWAQSPGEASKAYEASWGREGITEAGRNWGRGLKSTSDVLATSVPFVAAGGAPAIAGASIPARAAQVAVGSAPIAAGVMGEGPWGEADKGLAEQEFARAQAQARTAAPQTLAGFSPGQQQLHELRRRRIVEEIQRDPNLSEGEKARMIEDASVQAVEEMGRAQEGLLPFQDLEPPDAGPPAGQNANIPSAPGAPGASVEPTDSLQGLDPDKLPPGQARGARQAADQAAVALRQDPKATEVAANEILSPESNTPADQQAQGSLANQLGDSQTAMEMYGQMDPGAKLLLWGGLAIGAIGLLSALADEEGGGLMSWIMVLLGAGGALGAAGHGGFLGQGVQRGIQGLMGQITGKQQPPPAPSAASQAATQMARQQIESAESPAEALAALREDDLTGEESREMFENPGVRQHLMSLPGEDILAVVNEAAQNPEIAKMISDLAGLNPDQAMKVLTAPSGQEVDIGFWARLLGQQPTGMGLSPQEAEVMYAAAQRYAEQGQG